MILRNTLSIIVVILSFTLPNMLRAGHGAAGAPAAGGAGGGGGGAVHFSEIINAADCHEVAYDPAYEPIKTHLMTLKNNIAFTAPGVAATADEMANKLAQYFKEEAVLVAAEPFDTFMHFCKIPMEDLVFVAMYNIRGTVPLGGAMDIAARIEVVDAENPASAQRISPMLEAAHAFDMDRFAPLYRAHQHTDLLRHIGDTAAVLPAGALEIGHSIHTWATQVMNNFCRIYRMLARHFLECGPTGFLDFYQETLAKYDAHTQHIAALAEAGTPPYYKHVIITAFLRSVAAIGAAQKLAAAPELERAWANRANCP